MMSNKIITKVTILVNVSHGIRSTGSTTKNAVSIKKYLTTKPRSENSGPEVVEWRLAKRSMIL